MDGFCGYAVLERVVGEGFLPQLNQFDPGIDMPLLQPVAPTVRHETTITNNDHREKEARMVVRP